MSLLCDHGWKLKYTPDDGDLVAIFYIPALECATRYDRLTGYFRARALALAARGIEGLVRNSGRHAHPPGLARRKSSPRPHSHPRQHLPPVADGAAREVQSQLAGL